MQLRADWTKLAEEIVNKSLVLSSKLLFDAGEIHGIDGEFEESASLTRCNNVIRL